MPREIGSHLLGRRPSPRDSRNYRLGNFLGIGAQASLDPVGEIDAGIAELKLTQYTFAKWAATKYPDVTVTHWWKALDHFAKARAAIQPPPAPTGNEWENPEPVLDQGDTPHCVGFAGAQWGNTLPIDDRYGDPDGHAIYYECKVIDNDPKAEDGTYVTSLAKALLERSRLTAYAFASSVDEALAWVQTKGPVVFGTDWYDGMFNPDARGRVKPTGSVAGGHAYLCNGYDGTNDELLFINSWGVGWGIGGHFRIGRSDMNAIFSDWGEALAAAEIP